MTKYNNVRTTYLGMRFDSKAEFSRWLSLEHLRKIKAITELEHHPRFSLSVNGVKVCTYEADSAYRYNGHHVVEDVKGVKTAVYRLKKKLMKAIHNIDIQEVTA